MYLRLMLFASTCQYLAVATSSKSNMMVDSATESPTTIDNFAAVLKVGLSESNCCNVLTSGESATAKNMLEEFVKVYPLSYTLNQRTSDCSDFLVISTSVDGTISEIRSIPTTNPTIQLLILFGKVVDESSDLFNVSMYNIPNVIIAAPNGLWILENVFSGPKTFKKVPSYRETMNKKKKVNLQGRELVATAFYKPPFCYLQSTENRTVKGIEGEYYIAKNESEVDGIEIKLLMLMAEHLNFTWSISSLSKDERTGKANGSVWSGGIISQIIRKEVDIAFTNIWLTLDNYLLVNLTKSWGMTAISFLVPRPRPYTRFWALSKTLSPAIWSAFMTLLIIQSIYVWTKAWITPIISKRFRNFAITLSELMGVLLGTYHPTRLQGLEWQLKLWSVVGTLLVTTYSSSLAVILANSQYEKRIDTAQDFMEANLTWGSERSEYWMNLIFDYSDTYGKQFRQRYEGETSEADRHRKILQGNYAIHGSTITSVFYPDSMVTDEELQGFRRMKDDITQFQTSFAVQPWLLESVDMTILHLQQVGLVQYHVKNVLYRRTSKSLREVLVEHDGPLVGPKALHLTPLGAGFMMLIIGLSISTVVFYFELKSASKKKTNRKFVIPIKKNRNIPFAEATERKQEPSRLILFLKIFFYSVFYFCSKVKNIVSVIPHD